MRLASNENINFLHVTDKGMNLGPRNWVWTRVCEV